MPVVLAFSPPAAIPGSGRLLAEWRARYRAGEVHGTSLGTVNLLYFRGGGKIQWEEESSLGYGG